MARKTATQAKGIGRLLGAARSLKRMFTRGHDLTGGEQQPVQSPGSSRTASTNERSASTGRVTQRPTDIPLDVISQTYTPPVTSSKAGFRSDGSDHQRDQEFAYGVADDRWNDEDRFTNKSGDPRIGTHRRTYEPDEARTESRD